MVRNSNVALMLPAIFLAGCGKTEQRAEPPRPAMAVVARPSPIVEMTLTGTVQPQLQSPIGFRVLGRMIARPVKVGDIVEVGQTLAAVDPLALEMAARTATANLASARAQYDSAASTEVRQAALLAKKTASQAAFDAAEQERAAAKANMQQSEANLAKATEQLSYTELKADYSGIVTAAYAEVGQTVSPGQPVLALAEPSRRDAVIDAPDGVADALFIGEPFVVALEVDQTHGVAGRVREIAPDADAVTRSRRVKIALENPPASFRLGATIVAHASNDAKTFIRLPASAVLLEGEMTSVFVVDPKTLVVTKHEIEVAPDRDGRWIVRAGVEPGERIVAAGVHRLKDGESVRIYGSDAP